MNPTDYVYLKPSGSYYELATGTEMSAKALDAYWRGQHSGAKGDPVASRLFDLAKDHATMTADGFLWQPDQLQPTSPRVIRKEGRQEINEWRGLALSPIKGDVTLWLDLLAFLVPDERERRCVVQWMANLFLDIGRKPSWQIIHRGSLRNGKDSLYKPLAQIFGPRSAGDVRPTDVDAGWGDSFYGKKFLIFQEIYRPQDKSFSNLLKTFAAPTATGVREFNMKGKGIRSQVDCSGFVGMSNYRACLAVDRGDERYFVIDSFFAPLPTEFYTEYHAWLDSGGAGAVLYYLLNDVDMSDFSAGKLPFVTEGASELMSLARPDYEQAMEDLIAESKGVFALPVFTAAQAKEYLITQGHKMGRNGLTEALGLHGYAQHRGTKKVDGKVCNTPAFFTREDLSRRRPKEIYDYYVAAKDRGAGLARLMEKS
jgi:hypothetical protein